MSAASRAASILLIALAALAGCDSAQVRPGEASLRASTERVDFGDVPVGEAAFREVAVHNDGSAPGRVTVLVSPPFEAEPGQREVAPRGSATVRIHFSPRRAEAAEGLLVLEAAASGFRAEIPLNGRGVADACAVLPDGEPCAMPCLANGARCQSGACTGEPLDCGDQNPCTLDGCDAQKGCTHVESLAACPQPESPCQAPVCNADTGCALVDVTDGTMCGPADCSTAHVCIAGACVVRNVPEGAPCGDESVCQPRGVCRHGRCNQQPPLLGKAWTRLLPAAMGRPDALLADFHGNVFVVGQTVEAFDPQGQPLFSTAGNGLRDALIAEGLLVLTETNRVFALDTQGGAQRWSLDTRARVEAWFMDGGVAPQSVHATLARAGQGTLWIIVRGSAIPPGESSTKTLSWLWRVQTATGNVLSQVPLVTPEDWSVDESGRVLLTTRGYPSPPAVGELDPATGQLLWTQSTGDFNTRLMTAWNGRAIVSGQETASFGSGARRWSLPLHARFSDHSIELNVFSPVTDGDLLWLDAVRPQPPLSKRQLFGVDAATGAIRWSSQGFRELTQPVLTDAGTVLVLTRDEYVSHHVLRELDKEGKELLHCPLLSDNVIRPDPVITEGHLVMGHLLGGHPTRFELVAYPLPGYREAAHGWTSARGNSQRTRSPR